MKIILVGYGLFIIVFLVWLLWDNADYARKVAKAKERAAAAGKPEQYLLEQILQFTDMGGNMDSGELELMQQNVERRYGRRAWQK